jgi:hypothetical protein
MTCDAGLGVASVGAVVGLKMPLRSMRSGVHTLVVVPDAAVFCVAGADGFDVFGVFEEQSPPKRAKQPTTSSPIVLRQPEL